ncbi:MAG: hypothetical protein EP333_00895 [Bacteroidetes bacterium]|nr:MAG: hypothetical protein EP333_00895 [Bacteroidota bacterium]TNF00315.1 MAG: hypothetical protein EP322_01620 [Bacteroidota bacterium]
MIRLLILVSFITLTQSRLSAQIEWDFTFNAQTEEVELRAKLDEGWHLYSQRIENDLGPIPTSILFKTSDCFKLIGKTNEPESIQAYDPNFEGELNFFEHEVVFTQKVRTSPECKINGAVDYMICNETMCLPPTVVEFSIKIEE